MKSESKYSQLKDVLMEEVSLIADYIDRKGTQLRLEKALMLTKQIHKIAGRWKVNDFYAQLVQFERVLEGNTRSRARSLSETTKEDDRLPCSQWVNWILYLAMRDAILLAKICVECENTVKYWFGLITKGHHWRDSLIISSVLARLWFTSSKMVVDFAKSLYPYLCQISSLSHPSNAPKWPSAEFDPPLSLISWIHRDMKLPFRFVNDRASLWVPEKKSKKRIPFLHQYMLPRAGELSEDEDRTPYVSDTELDVDVFENITTDSKSKGEDLGALVALDEEDFGEAFNLQEPLADSLSNLEPMDESLLDVSVAKQQFDVDVVDAVTKKELKKKIKKGKNGSAKKKKAKSDVKLTSTRAPWKKFFANLNEKSQTEKGRRMLLKRCIKMMKTESNQKVIVKLRKLKKSLKSTEIEGSQNILTSYERLRKLIDKKPTKKKKPAAAVP